MPTSASIISACSQWPILQPNRTFIQRTAVDDVRRLVEVGGARGLDVSVDVIQGHLSSFDFLPAWLATWHRRNIFTDPEAVAAQAALVSALHGALDELPNYLGMTLGNEINQFSGAPHPDPMRATPDEVTSWLTTLLAGVPADSSVLRLHAEYDAVWYLDGHPFLPTHASRIGDVTAIHSWVFNGTAQREGGMSNESLRHAEYLVELSRAFATSPDRPVWLQEIGAPGNVVDESEAADFCERSVRHAADSPALWGITWWGSHDVSSRLADFPAFEHTLGLLDEDGRPKDIGLRFSELAAELRDAPNALERNTAVIVPVDDSEVPTSRAALGPGGSIFEDWMARARDNERPTLVTSLCAVAPGELALRHVDHVSSPDLWARSAYTSVSDADLAAPAEHGQPA